MSILILLFMIGMHILEDFHLQGIMANMKQKDWWDKQFISETDRLEGKLSDEGLDNYYKDMFRMYHNDYIPVLLLHGFGWSLCIHIPIIAYLFMQGTLDGSSIQWTLTAVILVQGLIHSYIDDKKANCFRINLIQDQSMHMIQIIASYVLFCVI